MIVRHAQDYFASPGFLALRRWLPGLLVAVEPQIARVVGQTSRVTIRVAVSSHLENKYTTASMSSFHSRSDSR